MSYREEDGIVVSVDGRVLRISELAQILATYEGWYFELRFIDPTDVEKRVHGVQ